jgi:hypothetical protein
LQQIAGLERRGFVEVWSDSKIKVGASWEAEIEAALTSAKVAVLLISPGFLASDFIWEKEMPRIIAHREQGMDVLPLIVRPCPWELEPELAKLQARPKDGRALSLGSEGQIDLDLCALVRELAKQIGKSPADVIPVNSPTSEGTPASRKKNMDDLDGEWEGSYNRTRTLRLIIGHRKQESFLGKMEYPNEGTITKVEGIVHKQWSSHDPKWAQVDRSDDNGSRLAVTFRETGYDKQSGSSISFDGEYRAIIDGDIMTGGWFTGTRLVGTFNLQRSHTHVSARASQAGA